MGKAARLRKALQAGVAVVPGLARRSVFARIRESVVGIVDAPDDWPAKLKASQAAPMTAIRVVGTGFVIDNRIVLTAKHVVQPFLDQAIAWQANKSGPAPRPPKLLFSTTFTGSEAAKFDMQFAMGVASRMSASNDHDIASLLIQTPPDASGIKLPRPLKLSATPCEEGDDVAICGYPLGWNLHGDLYGGYIISPSFSRGIVSAVLPHPQAPVAHRNIFQIDAMINPGNSGGPVFDARTGDVVGIVVGKMDNVIQAAPGQLLGGQDKIVIPIGLARALPIHLAERVIKTIETPSAVPLQP